MLKKIEVGQTAIPCVRRTSSGDAAEVGTLGCARDVFSGWRGTAMLRHAAVYVRIPFFFQAEDGIRDTSVTGVQTCALPISLHVSPAPLPSPGRICCAHPA